MAEVILSTEDITVLGGPSSINVDIDFGPEGTRGSQIFIGEGDPNSPSTVIGQSDIKILDLFINIKADDLEYLYVYQYVSENGINSWKKLFKIIPNIKSLNSSAIFSSGSTTINVPINQVVSPEMVSSITKEEFNVQVSIVSDNATATSISLGDPSGTGDLRVLPVTVNAAEFSGSAWADLVGTKTVQLFITVV